MSDAGFALARGLAQGVQGTLRGSADALQAVAQGTLQGSADALQAVAQQSKRTFWGSLRAMAEGVGVVKDSVLPQVDFSQVRHGRLKPSQIDYWLWRCIAPGSTLMFMLLLAVLYALKASKATEPAVKSQLNAVSLAFLLWGLFNAAAYAALAWLERSRAWELEEARTAHERWVAKAAFAGSLCALVIIGAFGAISTLRQPPVTGPASSAPE